MSINIDGTSPKLSWYIVLTTPYNHTKFQVKTHQGYIVLTMPYNHTKIQVKTHQGAGPVGKKV